LRRSTLASLTGVVPRKRRWWSGLALVIAYHVLECEVPYEEFGEDYFHRHQSGEAYAQRLAS